MVEDSELVLHPSVGRFIEKGADSSVYQFGDKVVKIYQHHVDSDTIELYRLITNATCYHLEQNPLKVKLSREDGTKDYLIRNNPILLAGVSSRFGSKIITVSIYIPGSMVRDISLSDRKSIVPHLEDLSEELNRKFNIKGIHINEPNVKLVHELGQLVITDLCTGLRFLSKPPKTVTY